MGRQARGGSIDTDPSCFGRIEDDDVFGQQKPSRNPGGQEIQHSPLTNQAPINNPLMLIQTSRGTLSFVAGLSVVSQKNLVPLNCQSINP